MGWLIGFAGVDVPAKLPPQHEQARYHIRETGLHAQAGGPQETCGGGKISGKQMFLVTGLGIHNGRILDRKDWRARLARTLVDLDDLDGHFVVLRWGPNQVELFTDPTGIRTIYCAQTQKGVYFSTRLDWLAKHTGPLEIDYAKFGAQWILPNSIHTTSLVKRILRLEPGGYAIIERGRIKARSRPWKCTITQSDRGGYRYELALLKSLEVNGLQSWSLGLSGGLDSRVLLALHGNCSTHVWGPPNHPDVRISQNLCRTAGIEQNYFKNQLPEVNQCIQLIRERVGLTQVITPASAAIERSAYGRLHAMGYGIIDGGFGEIARRQLMNQTVLRRILYRDPPNKPLPCPSTGKSDIFAPDVYQTMALGAQQELNAAWHSLPQLTTVADKADLISVRSRLPNFFGFEQNYLDNVCISYMPYAQPSVLHALFQVPLRLRWNGRMLRRILRKNAPAMSQFPLVKGTIQYPFRLGTISSFTYTQLKKRVKMPYHDPRPQEFMNHMREFVLDTLRSMSVRTCDTYDQAKLQHMTDQFACGDPRHTAQLDWWLAFDTWRRILRAETDQSIQVD